MFKFRFVLLFAFLLLVAACVPSDPATDSISVETAWSTATAVAPTPSLSAIDPLIAELTAAGATVVNNGRIEQGLFPGDDIGLWHLTINNIRVNVFEFSETAARQAVSDTISPDGYSFISPDGGYVTADGEGYPHYWAQDELLINYWGMDTAVADLITAVLGQPLADGSPTDIALTEVPTQTVNIEPTAEIGSEIDQDIFCIDIIRPAIIASTPDGHIISNPLTGEQCLLTLPRTFTNFSFANGDYAYGYSVNPTINQLQLQQLAADGTTQTLDFISPEEGDQLHSFILSEDGRQIIWSTTARGGDQILSSLWMADLDGQNQVQLVTDWPATGHVIEPIRSDGETVYFHIQWDGIGGMWNSFHGRYDSLYTVTPGSEPQKLFACEDHGLMLCLGDISPDNSVLAYTDYREGNTLHLIQADGTAITSIPLAGDYSGYPTFLPNGDLVYYTAVLNTDGNDILAPQIGTFYYLAAPYTGPAQEIVSSKGIMFPVATYDQQHLIINYSDELDQWGNALLTLTDGSITPLQPWPDTYFVALITAD